MAEALDERRDAAAAAEKERAERRETERQHCTQAAGLVGAMLAGLRPSAGLLTAGDAAAGSTGDRAASAEEDITSGSAEAAFLAGLQQAAEVLARPGAAEDEGLGPMQCLTGTLSLLCDAVSHYASVWRDWVQVCVGQRGSPECYWGGEGGGGSRPHDSTGAPAGMLPPTHHHRRHGFTVCLYHHP